MAAHSWTIPGMPAKPIYIIKLGSTIDELEKRRDDFEDWILAGLGVPRDDDTIIDVTDGRPLPRPNKIGGVLLTGSHDDLRDHHKESVEPDDWSQRTANWLPDIVEREIPLLGICYGHQLLAHALGGRVGDVFEHGRSGSADGKPPKSEFGTVEVTLTDAAAKDSLFGVLSNPTRFHATHSQSVVQLPPGARLLASSERDPHLAYAVGTRAWGVQFHPEFDVDITRTYIDEAEEKKWLAEQDDPDTLRATCAATPEGPRLLRRFAEIVMGNVNP